MMKGKYERVVEQFELYYPSLAKQAVDWWPSGRMFITVRLRNGDDFEFNPMDNTIRRICVNDDNVDKEIRRKTFGINLDKLISVSSMSKGELASRLGITNAMLSRYTKGTSIPSVDKAYEISRILGCRLEELFDDTYNE